MAMREIDDDSYRSSVAAGRVVVYFWAEWSAPCRMMTPVLEELAAEESKTEYYRLNIDENQETVVELGLTSVPAVYIYRDGEVVKRVAGFLPQEQIRRVINDFTLID